jgi:Phage integrase family
LRPEAAGFPFLVHSHVLRHSCGYKLANDGHDTRAIQHYLGHRPRCAIGLGAGSVQGVLEGLMLTGFIEPQACLIYSIRSALTPRA